MGVLSDDQVVKLLPALSEAARADEESAHRFVPPRVGIVEVAAARRHQFILGRRGVGKSTLLLRVAQKALAQHSVVVYIDLETLRGRAYPDVLIELLVTLLDELLRQLRGLGTPRSMGAHWLARRELRALRAEFTDLLQQPQSMEHTLRRSRARAKRRGAGAEGKIAGGAKDGVTAGLKLHGERSASALDDHSAAGTFTRTKMEALHAAAPRIRRALARGLAHLGQPSYILLDDFYHVASQHQPDVLAYLHQIVKNLDVFLKVGAVRHRLNPFVEGDPPRGLQVGHDADSISLDVTLSSFDAARRFLEEVLAGICTPHGIAVEDVLTDGARTRLVLASGGVARDYLNLLHRALRSATERKDATFRRRNKVTAEDVNEASAAMSSDKQQDLRLDSGPNADAVRSRLADIAKFCLDVHRKNVFIVEGTKLEEEDWGKEIQALADLRLLHEIGNVSIKNPVHRGKRFVAFTLDLSNYTGTRSEQIEQVEFWQPGGSERLRVPGLIYEPNYAEKLDRGERQPPRAARPLFDEQPLPFSDDEENA